jgi:TorA maturation chaperone TorD
MSTTKDPYHTELQSFSQSRKNFYQFLQLLFSDPVDGDALIQVKRNQPIQQLLKEIHEGANILSIGQIEQVCEEYHRLFDGPGPLAAPPWESYYRSKEQLLFEECNYEVRKQYHQFGLKNSRENNEPDDHLLLELDFMIYLANLSLQKKKSNERVEIISSQISFIENHLSIWIPFFCKRIIENTSSQLYLGAAILLEDFIRFDLQSLNEEMEALTNV